MRVLHLSPRPDAGSGLAAYSSRFRAALRAEGSEIVQLIAPADVLNSAVDVWAYRRAAVLESRRGYDVVHAELGGGALREFYALRAIQRDGGVTSCATLHDPPRVVWWPFHFHAVRQRPILASAIRRATGHSARALEAGTLRHTQVLFALTHQGVDATQDRFGQGLPLSVLPFPIDADVVAAKEAQGSTHLSIAFFGYWYAGKGLVQLADALRDLRLNGVPFRAFLWGDISPQSGTRPGLRYREAVMQRLRADGLAQDVEVLGFLDPNDVAARLHACDVVVLPYETSKATDELRSTSAAMFDAFAAGTPVIATDVKALGEQITHNVNGLLISPDDPGGLTSALTRLHADRQLRLRLRRGAQATAATLSARSSAVAALDGYRAASELGREREPLRSRVSGGAGRG